MDATASDVLAQCLLLGRSEFNTDLVGATDDLVDIVTLDDQCTTSFQFQVVGHEWWHDEALVRAVTTTYEVTIDEWGFEWYETAPAGNSCNRVVSTRSPRPPAKTRCAVSRSETASPAW